MFDRGDSGGFAVVQGGTIGGQYLVWHDELRSHSLDSVKALTDVAMHSSEDAENCCYCMKVLVRILSPATLICLLSP